MDNTEATLEATLDINGYTLFRKDREGRRGGGVCAYIKTSLAPSFHDSPCWKQEKQFEFFWFCCKSISSDSKFFYCTVYHPPNPVYKSDNLINAILTDIEDICTKYPGSVISIVGDFNKLDTTKLETEAGLVQLVTEPTHGKNILDKFFTNLPTRFSIKIASLSIKTKHKAIIANSVLVLNAKTSLQKKKVPLPDLRAHNIDRLRQALASHNWNALFSIDDDLDFLYEAFTNTLKAYYADFIPVKYVKMSCADPWFFSPLIKCLLHKRNILLHRGQTHKAAEISLTVNKLISKQRQKQLASVDSKNTKKLWHMIDKSSENRPRNKYSLNVDGHDALDMANDINDYFSKIATDDTYDLDSIQEAIANNTHVSADQSTCTLNNFEVCKMLMSIKKRPPGQMIFLIGFSGNVPAVEIAPNRYFYF